MFLDMSNKAIDVLASNPLSLTSFNPGGWTMLSNGWNFSTMSTSVSKDFRYKDGYLISAPTFQLYGMSFTGGGFRNIRIRGAKSVMFKATSMDMTEEVAMDEMAVEQEATPLPCDVAEGIVVAPYLQRRAESKGVNVIAECALKTYYCCVSLGVNPILTDFKIGGFRLHTLAHFNYHQEHTDYLIVPNSGDYVEIGFVTAHALFGVAYLNPFSAVGATVVAEAYLLPLVSAVHTYRLARFETIGVMVDGVAERPLLLGGGERAESPTQFHYMLLFLVSRFHLTGVLEVE